MRTYQLTVDSNTPERYVLYILYVLYIHTRGIEFYVNIVYIHIHIDWDLTRTPGHSIHMYIYDE